jgi:hypothetical protein
MNLFNYIYIKDQTINIPTGFLEFCATFLSSKAGSFPPLRWNLSGCYSCEMSNFSDSPMLFLRIPHLDPFNIQEINEHEDEEDYEEEE